MSEETSEKNIYDDTIIASKKFTLTKWNLIEKTLSEDEIKRNQIIIKLGENSSSNLELEDYNKSKLITMGSKFYTEIRTSIKSLLNLPEIKINAKNNETKKNKSSKKETKKDLKIIEDNINITLTKKIKKMIEILKDKPDDKIYSDLMNGNDYIEFRIIILMKIIDLSTNPHKSIDFKEELIIASKKIINTLKKIKQKQTDIPGYQFFNKISSHTECNLPDLLISDLEYKVDNLSKLCGVKLFDIANRKPKLIYDTIYDETIPDTVMKPHTSQIEFITIVKQNLLNGFLLLYKTLPGLGKTSMILAICTLIKKSSSKLKIIFCCSDILESVRVQVLRTMFNCNVKFGIATAMPNSDNFKITNSNNCASDTERELIVADYKSTYLILKQYENEYNEKIKNISSYTKVEQKKILEEKHNYLLFFDEPTVLTDQVKNKSTLEFLSRILYYMPCHTVLSSATLPLLEELADITNYYNNKYPNGYVREIISNKTLVGCFIKDFSSNIIVPHANCKNTDDLRLLLEKIKNFPLLGKFYTLPFLMNLNEFLKEYDFNIDLENIETFEHESVLENILLLLNRVLELNQEDFDKFKQIIVKDISEDSIDKEKLDDKFNEVDHTKILTIHAYKYIGCCLIATDNPLNYAQKYFYSIVDRFKEVKKIKNINKEYEKFITAKKKYDQEIENIQKKYTSQEKIDERIEILDKNKPSFKFPKNIEVNTFEHINAFASYVKKFDESLVKINIFHEKINILNFNIDDNLKFLLYMGVGLYSKHLDSDYTDKVLEMLSQGEIAFIIADESFSYGANYKISNVIINDDIGDSHSTNTILQLIGRTSRIGKSWAGKVYLDTNTKKKILDLFLNPNFNSNEGNNIVNAFNKTSLLILDENEKEAIKIEKNNKIKADLELKRLIQEEEKLKLVAKIEEDNDINEWKDIRRPRAEKTIESIESNPSIKLEEDDELLFRISSTHVEKTSNNNDDDWSSIRKEKIIPIVPETNNDEELLFNNHKTKLEKKKLNNISNDEPDDWSNIRSKPSPINNNEEEIFRPKKKCTWKT
jgi:hypothetical protein